MTDLKSKIKTECKVSTSSYHKEERMKITVKVNWWETLLVSKQTLSGCGLFWELASLIKLSADMSFYRTKFNLELWVVMVLSSTNLPIL